MEKLLEAIKMDEVAEVAAALLMFREPLTLENAKVRFNRAYKKDAAKWTITPDEFPALWAEFMAAQEPVKKAA